MGKIRGTARQQPVQQAYAIDTAIDNRLCNWAAWVRGRWDGGSPSSPQWRFASRGTRAASYAPVLAPMVDADDARRVEQVVCAPGFSTHMRAILKAHWVLCHHPRATCTALGLHHQAYDQWVQKAALYAAERWTLQGMGTAKNPESI